MMNAAVARFYWAHITGADRVLDLGCGAGDLGRHAPRSVEVYGLDLNSGALQAAASHETVRDWDLDSGEPFPFPDGFFDAVVARDILEHLQKPWLAMGEIRRVLKPGGLVLASVITSRSRRVWDDYTHVRGFTERAVRRMFDDGGFEVTGLWRMGPVPLMSRLNLIGLVPVLLRFPLLDWIWTSSYEVTARSRPTPVRAP